MPNAPLKCLKIVKTARTRVLVVEDEVAIRKELEATLEGMGYSVCSVVSSGRKAVRKALEERPDLVFMDIALKGEIDGIAAAEEIRSRADIPTVFSLGREDEEKLQRGKPIPPFGYVLKPHQERELKVAIETALHVARISAKQKRAEEALRKKEEEFRWLYEQTPLGFQSLDEEGRLVEVNRVWLDTLGYSREEVIGKPFGDFVHADVKDRSEGEFSVFESGGVIRDAELEMISKDGSSTIAAFYGKIGQDARGGYQQAHCVFSDMDGRNQRGERQKLVVRVLKLLNQSKGEPEILRDILLSIKKFAGMEAVGIRLKDGDDFPYFQVSGFPGDFVESERSLCVRDESGAIMRDSMGNFRLACMCGNVIQGRTDPSLPFFTHDGSFWTNSTSKLFASTSEEDLRGPTRNRCPGEGYESLALIPLRAGGEIIGLLQLNDHRKGMFTRGMIGFFEEIGVSIGIALLNIRAVKALRQSEEHLRSLVDSSIDGIVSVDLDRKMTSCNPAFLKQFGYRREEIIGQSVALVHPSEEHFVRFGSVCYSVVDRNGFWRGEWEYQRKDGSPVPMETVVSELRLPEGGPFGYVAVMRDISERKRVTEVLRQKEYLDALHETSLGLLKRQKLSDLLEAIVARACALVGCDHGYVFLYDSKTKHLEMKSGWGRLRENIGFSVKPGEGLAGRVFETGAPLTVNDYRNWEGRLPNDQVRAAVGIPLSSRSKVHGSIGLVHFEEGKSFGEEEVNILSRFAELASITLENVRLYDALEGELEEKRHTEEALSESEEKYRLLVENSGDIVYSLGPDYRFTYISPVVERLIGYTAEEASKHTLNEWFTPSSAEILRNAYRRRIREEKHGLLRDDVERWELEHRHKDGSTGWGEVSVRPVRHADGRLAGLQGVTRDITARKRAERALRESEEKYRLVAYATSDIIFEYRIDSGVYTYISPNCEEILGYTAEELSSAPHFLGRNMVRPEDFEETKKAFVAAVKNHEKQITYEFRVRCKDGREKHLLENSTIIRGADGRATTLIGSYKDITEKKRMEAQLRQSQKMEAIGTLAGGIAHDFNNILAAIMGYTELALIDLPKGHRSGNRLQQVLKSGERAKSLVQQILNFSRQTDQQIRPLELRSIVKEALKLLRPSLPSTIEIRQYLETNTAIVLADLTQIHQVVMNLCMNAAHAMRHGAGVLEIRLERVELDEDSAKQYAELSPGRYQRLSVSDTGQGMDRETLDRIFEPFFTTKEAGEGTGMGLAVVHGIVKSHEGTITAYSEPGKGSTFRVYLPEIQEKAEDVPSEDAGSMPTGKERILFVDDESALVDIGRQTMEGLGYKVTGVTSSTEALDLFMEAPDEFDLVITDQTMPNMTGIDLAGEMLKIRPGIPIVLCTGFSHEATAEEALARGLKRFLMKPLNAREVARVVRDVLDTG